MFLSLVDAFAHGRKQIYIWDLNTPNKPFSPGARSRSIEDITALAWNSHVVHVLATGSNSGYTVVWDLKSKREVTALSYSAGAPTGVGAGFGTAGWSAGGSRSVSAVQWHPDNVSLNPFGADWSRN
jgi:protein transport protein SEC31